MKPVKFFHAQYLGGLPDTKPQRLAANELTFHDDGITVAKRTVCHWPDIAGVGFDTGTAKKSRAGAAMLVGVFALAAKNTQNEAIITVTMKDGNAAIVRIEGKSGAQIRAKAQPFLAAHGVPCTDDGAVAAPISMADELAKLASLRDSGVLTDAEFSAQKERMLA